MENNVTFKILNGLIESNPLGDLMLLISFEVKLIDITSLDPSFFIYFWINIFFS